MGMASQPTGKPCEDAKQVVTNRPSFLEEEPLGLLLFGGKGGVGKTTCAVAAALDLARRFPERRFLLVSTDPAHSLCDSVAGSVLPPNLETREIDFRASLEAFKQAHAGHLRQIALRGTFLDEQDVAALLDLSIPGFDELMAFTEIADLAQSGDDARIILDTAPTGHTLRFLELPGLMRRWVRALDTLLAKHRYLAQLYRGTYCPDDTDAFLDHLAASSRRLATLLADPARCRFVPVMLAEAASVRETERLVARLQESRVAVSDILVNRIYPERSDCPICHAAYRRQQKEMRRAVQALTGYDVWGIPQQGGEVRGEQLSRFWKGATRILPSSLKANARESSRTSPVPLRVEQPAGLPEPSICLVLIAGKGGVGKTTLACATAARLAQEYPDRNVLLFSSDPAHPLTDCLQVRVGRAGVRLDPGFTAMEVDAEAEWAGLKRRYAAEVETFLDTLVDRETMDLEFERAVVERLFDLSPPGLDEVMALLRAMELLEAGKHDLFVLDTAPTGHLIRLLEMPELLQGWLKAIFGLFLKYKSLIRLPRVVEYLVEMSKQLKRLRGLLADPRSGQVRVVTILTEMAYEETRDLVAACRRTGVHVAALILNLATPDSDCTLCRSVAASETRVRSRLAETFDALPQTVVYRWEEPRGVGRLAQLGRALYA